MRLTLPLSLAFLAWSSTGLVASLGATPLSPLESDLLGLSPFDLQRRFPSEPDQNVTGAGGWEDAKRRAADLVAQLTIEEKVNLTTGIVGRCVGNTGSVHRFGIPEFCLEDGPAGVRPTDGASAFPDGVTTAATWDRDLMYLRAKAMGQEFYGKGVHIALQPVTGGPLGRSPYDGRNWEGWSPDPYLTGVGSYQSVAGTQDAGVSACSKHYILYEQETFRGVPFAPYDNPLTISENANDKTIHELYLWPFAEALRAGTAAIMCSYNTCESNYALNRILKDELDFQGIVISDWGAVYSTSPSANNGLDMEMPGGPGAFFGANLTDAINSGQVPGWRLDDMAERILLQYFLRGQDSGYPATNFHSNTLATYLNGTLVNEHVNVQADHRKIILEIATDAITLYKNDRTSGKRGLPLNKPKSLAVYGSDAGPSPLGANGCHGAGTQDGGNVCPANSTNNGTFALGGGSGGARFPYLIDPLAALQARAREEGTWIDSYLDDFSATSDTVDLDMVAGAADAALVFVQARASEGSDRTNLSLWDNGDELIKKVASINPNTIVVMHTVGPVWMDDWFHHPNVSAVVHAYLPGQESGNAIVRILYGDVAPSGKSPFSVLSKKDAAALIPIIGTTNDVQGDFRDAGRNFTDPQEDFTEGVFIDYRSYDAKNITPLIEFGFGLSYTTFGYSNMNIRKGTGYSPTRVPVDPNAEKGPGGRPSDFEYLLTASVDVTNTGKVTASEVAQLYLGFPPSAGAPPKQLRGFFKVKNIEPGKSATATFNLTRKDFSVWDTATQRWQIPSGEFTVMVGKSSRKIVHKATVTAKNGELAW